MRTASQKCTICGEAATATWGGRWALAVCPRCAVEVLPLLIADAIALPRKKPHDAAALVWAQVTEVFWRGIKARQIRRRCGEGD